MDATRETDTMTRTPPSDRTRLRRVHERARYDRASLNAILDAGLLCHVGYVIDGAPDVTPTLYWRDGDRVYRHGSSASRMLRAVDAPAPCPRLDPAVAVPANVAGFRLD